MKKQIKSTNSPWNKNELRVMKLVENSTSSDVQVRANVAKSKYAPPEVLDDLARDEAPGRFVQMLHETKVLQFPRSKCLQLMKML